MANIQFKAEKEHSDSSKNFTFDSEATFIASALSVGSKEGDVFRVPILHEASIRLGRYFEGAWFASHVVSYESLQKVIDRYTKKDEETTITGRLVKDDGPALQNIPAPKSELHDEIVKMTRERKW